MDKFNTIEGQSRATARASIGDYVDRMSLSELGKVEKFIGDLRQPDGSHSKVNKGVVLPLLLADELFEDCWKATSKLESQLLRDDTLPESYREVIEKSFAILRLLHDKIMAR